MSGQTPVRAVLDSNIVIAATLNPDRTPAIVISKILEGEVESFTSPAILEEMRKVVARLDAAEETLHSFTSHSRVIIPIERVSACTDSDDDRFLECAVAADAQFIVSGDHALLAMKRFRNIRILGPQEFLTEIAYRR